MFGLFHPFWISGNQIACRIQMRSMLSRPFSNPFSLKSSIYGPKSGFAMEQGLSKPCPLEIVMCVNIWNKTKQQTLLAMTRNSLMYWDNQCERQSKSEADEEYNAGVSTDAEAGNTDRTRHGKALVTGVPSVLFTLLLLAFNVDRSLAGSCLLKVYCVKHCRRPYTGEQNDMKSFLYCIWQQFTAITLGPFTITRICSHVYYTLFIVYLADGILHSKNAS